MAFNLNNQQKKSKGTMNVKLKRNAESILCLLCFCIATYSALINLGLVKPDYSALIFVYMVHCIFYGIDIMHGLDDNGHRMGN